MVDLYVGLALARVRSLSIYGHALCGPPPNGLGPPPLVWVVVGLTGSPLPSFPLCGVGSGGWESPSLLLPLWCGVLWVGIPSLLPPLWCGVWWVGIPLPPLYNVGFGWKSWWGRIRGPSRVGSPGGREASLMRQTIFCGRRFCSETLGCPFRCFGRRWRFLLGTLQCRAIKSVLMTSRPPIIDYTLCHILHAIYSRPYTTYCRLYSVYMVYVYTIARPLKGGNQVLHTSLRAMWELGYILQHTIV